MQIRIGTHIQQRKFKTLAEAAGIAVLMSKLSLKTVSVIDGESFGFPCTLQAFKGGLPLRDLTPQRVTDAIRLEDVAQRPSIPVLSSSRPLWAQRKPGANV